MRLKGYSILAISFILFLCACECTKVECAFSNPIVYFRVIDAEDSSDLIFGSTAKLNREDILTYSVDDGDTTFLDISNFDSFGLNDSLLTFTSPDFLRSRVFIDYSTLDIDTLDIVSTPFSGSCCEGRLITSIEHNGTEVLTNTPVFFITLPK